MAAAVATTTTTSTTTTTTTTTNNNNNTMHGSEEFATKHADSWNLNFDTHLDIYSWFHNFCGLDCVVAVMPYVL